MSGSETFTNIGGAWLARPPKRVRMINRTGSALAQGDIVAQNRDFAATAGQAMVGITPGTNADGATGWIGGAAISPTTANLLRGAWVADEVIADNASGWFIEEGECTVKMNTTAGYLLAGTNASAAATGYADTAALDAITTPIRIYGLCLETTTTTGKALWNANGFAGFVGGGG